MSARYSEETITTALLGLIAWAGNLSATSRYLKAEKGITLSPTSLSSLKTLHAARYDELREKYQGQLEANLAHELRDCARLAVEVERLALEAVKKRLEAGKENDPARAAANLATVASKNTDKVLSLTGRPTQITESRDAAAILRGLRARFPQVFPLTEEPKAIEGSSE